FARSAAFAWAARLRSLIACRAVGVISKRASWRAWRITRAVLRQNRVRLAWQGGRALPADQAPRFVAGRAVGRTLSLSVLRGRTRFSVGGRDRYQKEGEGRQGSVGVVKAGKGG